jgi:hypothetical protein
MECYDDSFPNSVPAAAPARRPSNTPQVGNEKPSAKLKKDLMTVGDKVRFYILRALASQY